MNKSQFEAYFIDEVLPLVSEEHEQNGAIDRPARRQAWNDAVDAFIRSGDLPERAGNWTHPSWLEKRAPARMRRANPHPPFPSKKGDLIYGLYIPNREEAFLSLEDALQRAFNYSSLSGGVSVFIRAYGSASRGEWREGSLYEINAKIVHRD